ncbi:MAG: sugar ABC transporter substrate-binding protein [Chloroflexota bacterium]|nr:MAG: sugar ABC transporter substrate-binding protein [Chloroflexota bacterium]
MNPASAYTSRRSFLRSAAGLGGLLAAGALASACGSAAPTPSPKPAAAPTAAPAPAAKPIEASKPAATKPIEAPKPAAVATKPAAATPASAQPAAGAKAAELSWIWTSNTAEEQQFWESQAEFFRKKYPNITVKPQFLGGGEIYDKIQTLAAGGAAPDIIFWQGFRVQAWAARKIGRSLEPYIKADKFDLEDFDPEIWKMMSYKGENYGLPYDFGAVMAIYNREMFQKAGAKPPSADWTRDDFLESMKKITKEGEQWGFVQSPDFFWGLVPFLWSNGATYMNDDATQMTFDAPETTEVIQWYADLRLKHKVAPSVEAGATAWRDAFYTGKVGMYIDGPWQALTLRSRAKFDWDFGLIPKGKSGRTSWIAGSGYALSASSKVADQGWLFAKEMTSKENLAALAKAGRGFPARKSAMQSYLDVKPPANPQVSVDSLKEAKYLRTHTVWQEMNNLLNKQLDKVYLGQAQAASAMKEIKPQIDDLMKKHLQLVQS